MPRPNNVGVGTSVVLTRFRASEPRGLPRRQVLLGRRRRAHGANQWAFSGGWIDCDDASIEVAAVREVREETGIALDPAELKLLCVTTELYPEFRAVTLFYEVACPPDCDAEAPPPLEPHKCEEWRWFFADEPPDDLFGGVGEALRRLAKQPGRVPDRFPRDAQAIMCACGGYAEQVNCTEAEIEAYDCGRGRKNGLAMACCARAFVCRVCDARIVGTAESPEMG